MFRYYFLLVVRLDTGPREIHWNHKQSGVEQRTTSAALIGTHANKRVGSNAPLASADVLGGGRLRDEPKKKSHLNFFSLS